MRGSRVESDGDSVEEREVDNSSRHLHIMLDIMIYFACFIVDPTQSVRSGVQNFAAHRHLRLSDELYWCAIPT